MPESPYAAMDSGHNKARTSRFLLKLSLCDCPQVLLSVRTPVYRKERNVCKGNLSRVSPYMLNRPPAGDHFCRAKVPLQKERHPYGCLSFWSRVRESNPPPRLGKPMYYRCTNPAHLLPADYIKLPAVLQPLFSSNPENIYTPPRLGWAVPVRAAYIQMT